VTEKQRTEGKRKKVGLMSVGVQKAGGIGRASGIVSDGEVATERGRGQGGGGWAEADRAMVRQRRSRGFPEAGPAESEKTGG